MKPQQLIFIYGTLRQGGRAHHLMAGAEFLGYGTTLGRLVHVDQYPGFINESDRLVKGELYRVSDELVKELDSYEGCHESPPHYTRESVDVLLENGDTAVSSAYIFQRLNVHLERIESGDWLEWLDSFSKS